MIRSPLKFCVQTKVLFKFIKNKSKPYQKRFSLEIFPLTLIAALSFKLDFIYYSFVKAADMAAIISRLCGLSAPTLNRKPTGKAESYIL